jgi:hypothetical protein
MDLLQTGLDEIVAIVGPNGSESWNTVGTDSERLLKVWVAKESDDPAAIEVAQQLTDILWELSADKIASEPASPPRLVIKEPAAPVNTPALADTIRHVQPFSLSTPVAVEIKEVTVVEEASIIESDEESSVNQIDDASVAASEEEAASVADEEVEEEASVAASEDEEEVLEPPVEEEEEEGMSVEQITIRGRTYWRDTDTDDLYAVVGEDDVGDKVGQIVNGVARFLPLKK